MLLPLSCGLRRLRRCLVCYALRISRPPLDESPWASQRFCGSLQTPQPGPSTTPRLKPQDGFARLARCWRENQIFGAGIPSSLRRATYIALIKVAFFRISLVFFRITLDKLFTEFEFCALHLPRISPWASICGEVLLF
jgi:hypothetical protein